MTYINDEVFDQGLDYADLNGTRVDLCSQEPVTYTEATSTHTLCNKTGINIGAPENGATDGRRVIVPEFNDGDVTATGTATHWALTNGTDTLIATGALLAPRSFTSGNKFRLEAISITIRDAMEEGSDGGIFLSDFIVAHWSLDEASNNNRADSTGNGHTMVQNDTNVQAVAGIINNGVSAGSGGQNRVLRAVDHADLSALGNSNAMSIAFWFRKPTSLPAGSMWIASKWFGGSTNEWRVLLDSGGTLYWQLMDATSGDNTTAHSAAISADTWYLFIGSVTASQVKSSLNAGTEQTTSKTITMADGSHSVQIGDDVSAGEIIDVDECCIIDGYELTADDRTWLYNSGAGRSWSDFQSYPVTP